MKRTRLRDRRRYVDLIPFLILIALIFLGSLCIYVGAKHESAYEYHDVGIWVVEEGDTLWNIANEHCNETHDTRKVIVIIQSLNNDLSATIYPGQVIDVPLFENMDWEDYRED